MLTAELVDSCVEGLEHPLLDAQVLDAPGARRPDRAGDRRVVEQAPVGADDAVEAVPLAEQLRDHAAVEPEADLLQRGPDRHPVVRHHLRRPGLERRLEGDQVVVEVAAGIDLLAAVGEMRVLAVALRAAAGEVLRHARDARRPEALTLEATDVGGDHLRGELGVLAEGAGRPRPPAARWRGRPRDGGRRGSRRRRTPAGRCRRTRRRARCHGRGQPERLGPLREMPAGPTRRRVGAEAVTRVGGDGDRDCEPRLLGEPLQPVVPLGEQPRLGRPVDVEVGQEAIADEIRRRRARRTGRAPRSARPPTRPRAPWWNIIPAFSSSVIWESRSATRSSTGRRGSSNGSSLPLRLRSRYAMPSSCRSATSLARESSVIARGALQRGPIDRSDLMLAEGPASRRKVPVTCLKGHYAASASTRTGIGAGCSGRSRPRPRWRPTRGSPARRPRRAGRAPRRHGAADRRRSPPPSRRARARGSRVAHARCRRRPPRRRGLGAPGVAAEEVRIGELDHAVGPVDAEVADVLARRLEARDERRRDLPFQLERGGRVRRRRGAEDLARARADLDRPFRDPRRGEPGHARGSGRAARPGP